MYSMDYWLSRPYMALDSKQLPETFKLQYHILSSLKTFGQLFWNCMQELNEELIMQSPCDDNGRPWILKNNPCLGGCVKDIYVCLPGGSVGEAICDVETMYELNYSRRILFSCCDERFVAPDSPLSNSYLYREGVKSRSENFFRTQSDCFDDPDPGPIRWGDGINNIISFADPKLLHDGFFDDSEENLLKFCSIYEQLFVQNIPKRNISSWNSRLKIEVPRVLDLLVLGMGEDGHICSLFPDYPDLWHHPDSKRSSEGDRRGPPPPYFTTISNSPKPPSKRITLTIDALIEAPAHIMVVCSGQAKKEMLEKQLHLAEQQIRKRRSGSGSLDVPDSAPKYPLVELLVERAEDMEIFWCET
ncbi:MAG: suppressor of los1-1 [Marteilia pararefringens]